MRAAKRDAVIAKKARTPKKKLLAAVSRVDDGIVDMPEMPLDDLMEDFVVADRRLKKRIPIDQSLAAINQTLLV